MDGDVQIALGTGDVRPLGLLGGTGEVRWASGFRV